MENNETAAIDIASTPALATMAKAAPTRGELVDVIIDEMETKLNAAYEALTEQLKQFDDVEFTFAECANTLNDKKFRLCSFSSELRFQRESDVSPLDTKVYAIVQEIKELRKQRDIIHRRRNLVAQPRKIKAYITKKLLEQTKGGASLLEALKHIADTFTTSSIPIE